MSQGDCFCPKCQYESIHEKSTYTAPHRFYSKEEWDRAYDAAMERVNRDQVMHDLAEQAKAEYQKGDTRSLKDIIREDLEQPIRLRGQDYNNVYFPDAGKVETQAVLKKLLVPDTMRTSEPDLQAKADRFAEIVSNWCTMGACYIDCSYDLQRKVSTFTHWNIENGHGPAAQKGLEIHFSWQDLYVWSSPLRRVMLHAVQYDHTMWGVSNE